MIGGAFFAFLLGTAAVVIATMLQQSYILPGDAERDVGLHCLGEVEVPGLDATEAPSGYSLIASNLLRLSIEGKPLSMVLIASTSSLDESEDLTRHLGVEFARVFATRTLILDLRPSADRVRASPLNVQPLRLQSASTATVPAAATAEDDLWVSVNAYETLFGEQGRMSATAWQAISALRDQYAMTLVIVSSGLSHPMVRRIASTVDATVLAVYAEKTRSAVAERYREVTLDAGGNLGGFIFVGRRYYVPKWLYRRL
jgi:hypothetical protein